MRHELVIFTEDGKAALRRTLPDGRRKVWCGREAGWVALPNIYTGIRMKVYETRANARKALRRILAHERELGLAGGDYERR